MMFGFSKHIGGVIEYYHLEDFWNACTQKEKDLLDTFKRQGLSTGATTGLTDGKPNNGLYTSKLAFFSTMLGWAKSSKEYTLCDKLIEYGDKTLESSDLVEQHFYLQQVAEVYYVQREINEKAKQLCEKYALMDVDLFPKYRKALEKAVNGLPLIKTFQRLAIMYEKDHNFASAKRICLLAIKYGLSDSTAGGYEARLQKLEKKLHS